MSYLGFASLRHLSIPIKHRRIQVGSESSSTGFNISSAEGCSGSGSVGRRFNVFSATHDGEPLFSEMSIGDSESRPFNSAILPQRSLSENIDFNLRVSNMMLRFYRWTRSKRVDSNIDLNVLDSFVPNSEGQFGGASSDSSCDICSPWDLGYSWPTTVVICYGHDKLCT